MYSVKTAVKTALSGTAISTYTSSIHYFHPQSFNNMPCVSFKEIDSVPRYTDDEETGASIYYQIDIWSTDSSTALYKSICSAMATAGFDRIGGIYEQFDDKQQIYQKSIRYKFDYES